MKLELYIIERCSVCYDRLTGISSPCDCEVVAVASLQQLGNAIRATINSVEERELEKLLKLLEERDNACVNVDDTMYICVRCLPVFL